MGRCTGVARIENSMEFAQEIEYNLSHVAEIPLVGIYPKKIKSES